MTNEPVGEPMIRDGDETGPESQISEPGRMQIGVVAERLGLSHRTLHHWEEAGLVQPSGRSSGGFRLYTEADIDRLITVRRMKPLGFTLDEMKQLLASLDLLDDPGSDEAARRSAYEFIATCQLRADESIAKLRQRLEWAEEFRGILAQIGEKRT